MGKRGALFSTDLAVLRGDRRAVRVDIRLAEEFVDSFNECVRDGMFECIGVAIDFIPSEPERLDQEQFKQSMTPKCGQRYLPTLGGERHSVIGLVPEIAGGIREECMSLLEPNTALELATSEVRELVEIARAVANDTEADPMVRQAARQALPE